MRCVLLSLMRVCLSREAPRNAVGRVEELRNGLLEADAVLRVRWPPGTNALAGAAWAAEELEKGGERLTALHVFEPEAQAAVEPPLASAQGWTSEEEVEVRATAEGSRGR